jgi:hypothetical protein
MIELTQEEIKAITHRTSLAEIRILWEDIFKKEMPVDLAYQTAANNSFRKAGHKSIALKLVEIRGHKNEMPEYNPFSNTPDSDVSDEPYLIFMITEDKTDEEIREEMATRKADIEWVNEKLIAYRKILKKEAGGDEC